jgi:hypothetical protein
MDLGKIDCENGRWIELAQYCIQRWALVLAVLKLLVLLPEGLLISKMDFRETGCDDGRWIELAPILTCGASDVETSACVTIMWSELKNASKLEWSKRYMPDTCVPTSISQTMDKVEKRR